MSAAIGLFRDPDHENRLDVIRLSDVEIIEGIGEGQSQMVFGANMGDTALRNVSVDLDGEGAQFVQLATDIEGEPGVWAAPGEGIILGDGTIFPGGEFSFWVRPVYSFDDREGDYLFEFVMKAKSIGASNA